MDRKRFLLTIGAAALAPLAAPAAPGVRAAVPAAKCRFSPGVPEGPFYFDSKLARRDIAEVYASPHYKAHGPNPARVTDDVELNGDVARFNALMMNLRRNGGRHTSAYTFGIAA